MRPREFDIEEARQKALDVFWAKGYEAASVDDLCAAMGLSRSSFYQAFGCKRDLLCAVLDDYADASREFLEAVFRQYRPVQAAVRAVLENAVMAAIAGDGRRGCLIGNMAAELAPRSAENAAELRGKFDIVHGAFERALAEARERGELGPDSDPSRLAWSLVSTLMGLKLLAKTTPDRNVLQPVVDQAVRGIE